ncbi:hypothetical protein C8Q76DRAFT_788966 [Earliella scabrosa]|nr:hypothetical protein C8Q76DRAFT_788966 [Earliella scabrosa]
MFSRLPTLYFNYKEAAYPSQSYLNGHVHPLPPTISTYTTLLPDGSSQTPAETECALAFLKWRHDLNASSWTGDSQDPLDGSQLAVTSISARTRHINERKRYFRLVSQNVGFQTTDPDTIKTHKKKRRYLECLEAVATYLCGHINSLGAVPLMMPERRPTPTGLKNWSLRTVLVLRQRELRRLGTERKIAELKLLGLRNQSALLPPIA